MNLMKNRNQPVPNKPTPPTPPTPRSQSNWEIRESISDKNLLKALSVCCVVMIVSAAIFGYSVLYLISYIVENS